MEIKATGSQMANRAVQAPGAGRWHGVRVLDSHTASHGLSPGLDGLPSHFTSLSR